VPFLKRFTVFNVAQCDGLPESDVPAGPPVREREIVPRAEALMQATGAHIRSSGGAAFYSPALDAIRVPPQSAFFQQIDYYRTCFHELGHWTGHPKRLNRDLSGRFGSDAYAREELVALSGQSAPASIDLGGLVQVANRRAPRATRSAPTSDVVARAGGTCLPTWASPGMGVRGKGANRLWITLRSWYRPSFRFRSGDRPMVWTGTFRSFCGTAFSMMLTLTVSS
jgi:hypothetical protein